MQADDDAQSSIVGQLLSKLPPQSDGAFWEEEVEIAKNVGAIALEGMYQEHLWPTAALIIVILAVAGADTVRIYVFMLHRYLDLLVTIVVLHSSSGFSWTFPKPRRCEQGTRGTG